MSRTAAPSSATTISTAAVTAAMRSTAGRTVTAAQSSTAAQGSTAGQPVTVAQDSTAVQTVTAALDSTAAALRLLRRSMDQRPRNPSRALVPAPSAGSIMEAWREAFRRAGSRVSEVDSTVADSTAAEVTDDSSQGSIRIIGSSHRDLGAGKQGPAS